jgi:predicted amidohydrolase
MRKVQLVSVVQYEPTTDVSENVRRAKQMSFEAASKDAKIILLPELCFGRFQLRGELKACDVAQSFDGPYTNELRRIATRCNCYIAFGYVRASNDVTTNSCVVVNPAGTICNYDKRNLSGNDELWFDAGECMNSPVVNTPWGRLGVMIGLDARNIDRSGRTFYAPGYVDIMCLLTDAKHDADCEFPKTEYFDLVDRLDLKLLMVSGYGSSCIIDDKHNVWTYGLYFSQPSVVGGALVMG